MTVFPVAPPSFGANCYLLIAGTSALAVDPALPAPRILGKARELGVTLEGILLTHGHFDHITSVDTLRDLLPCPVMIHAEDASMLTDGVTNAYYDFYGESLIYRAADRLLTDGEELILGGERIRVLHTPGHSRGSVCYDCGGALLTGDTLFADSIGRCDLYGGDVQHMRESLRRLRALPKETPIFPGHGAPSSLGAALDNAAYYL